MNKIRVGLIGLGTVGTGVAKVLLEKRAFLKKRTGIDFELAAVVDRNIKRKRDVKLPKGILTTDIKRILEDDSIDIVVELIGGYHPAKEFIESALGRGKSVVTANKALLARHGIELFKHAKKDGGDILFEASVCGGIPLILSVSLGLIANEITGIYGIVNGTCNYILTKMAEEGMGFDAALKGAQEKGFAEADPSADIDGLDSMHKLVILSSIAFHQGLREKNVFVEGIRNIDINDLNYAKNLGYTLKLLAIAKQSEKGIELRVHPTLIPEESSLASVRNELNAVYLTGDIVGETMFYGRGAGMFPTASAVVSDIISAAQDRLNQNSGEFHFIELPSKITKRLLPKDEFSSAYYLRINAKDEPGVLSKISGILGKNKVSILSVIQEEKSSKGFVPLIFITHKSVERLVQKSIKEINSLDIVKGKTVSLRIEKEF
ncbi:MAG: homoserine dehydrogenase [Candidatus Diapherotrites archaeon]